MVIDVMDFAKFNDKICPSNSSLRHFACGLYSWVNELFPLVENAVMAD